MACSGVLWFALRRSVGEVVSYVVFRARALYFVEEVRKTRTRRGESADNVNNNCSCNNNASNNTNNSNRNNNNNNSSNNNKK